MQLEGCSLSAVAQLRSESWPQPRLVLENSLRWIWKHCVASHVIYITGKRCLVLRHRDISVSLRPSSDANGEAPRGRPSVLIFVLLKRKKNEMMWKVMCLLVLMVATDAPLEGTPKTQFCNFQTFSLSTPQMLSKVCRLFEKARGFEGEIQWKTKFVCENTVD